MSVEIIAPAALDAINEYHTSKGQPGQQQSMPMNLDAALFSPEAFIKALIAFIAATDQVGYILFLYVCSHTDYL